VTLKAPLALSEPNEQACVEQMQLYTNDDDRLQVELNVEKQQTGQPWRLCLMQIKIKTFHKKYFLLHTVVVAFVI